MFRVVDSFCVRGSKIMEDSAGWGENYLFVIDGATGLTNYKITDWDSDAEWLSERLREILCTLLSDVSKELFDILREASETLKLEYEAMKNKFDNSPITDYPSAGISIFRIKNKEIEYFGLGDCPAILEFKNGGIDVLIDNLLPSLDHKVINRMKMLVNDTGCTVFEARRQVSELLIAHRRMKNTKEGYWIFDPSGKGVPNARYKKWSIEDVCCVSLMTDGFAQAVDPFQIVSNLEMLHKKLKNGEMATLASELFNKQKLDRNCEKHPRFKFRDDTTVIFSEIICD